MAGFLNRGKRSYSEKEKRAFDAGKAYARARKGKRMGLKTKKEQESFKNGYRRG